MNHLGHCRALQVIEALPDCLQPLAVEVSLDHGGDVGLPRRDLPVGVFGQLLEVVGVHMLCERELERWDPPVGVISFHLVSIAYAG